MNPTLRMIGVSALSAALVIGSAMLLSRGDGRARAADEAAPCTAFIAGIGTSKGSVPELVIFNLTDGTLTLDVTLRDDAGTTLHTIDDLELEPRRTVFTDLAEELSKDLPKGQKPYAGPLVVEVRGESGFDADAAIVHVVQYFGSKTKPRAAYVLRPVYRAD